MNAVRVKYDTSSPLQQMDSKTSWFCLMVRNNYLMMCLFFVFDFDVFAFISLLFRGISKFAPFWPRGGLFYSNLFFFLNKGSSI